VSAILQRQADGEADGPVGMRPDLPEAYLGFPAEAAAGLLDGNGCDGQQAFAVQQLAADGAVPAAGIALPWAEEISYFAAFLLTAAAQLVLYYFCKAKVDVTYAQAYQALLDENE